MFRNRVPAIVVFTEWLGHRRRDAVLTGLAHTWAKAMGVLFAAGAVSGTLLSWAAAEVSHLVCASSVAAYSPAQRWRRVREDWPCGGVPDSAYSTGRPRSRPGSTPSRTTTPPWVGAHSPMRGGAARRGRATVGLVLGPRFPRRLLGVARLPVPLWKGLRLQLVHADVARAIVLILRRGAVGAFNLVAEPVLRARDLVDVLGGTRVPVPLRLLTGSAWLGWRLGLHPLHPGWLRLADRACLVDSSRAAAELGWQPRHDAASAASAAAELVLAMRSGRSGPSDPLAPDPEPIRFGQPSHQSQQP